VSFPVDNRPPPPSFQSGAPYSTYFHAHGTPLFIERANVDDDAEQGGPIVILHYSYLRVIVRCLFLYSLRPLPCIVMDVGSSVNSDFLSCDDMTITLLCMLFLLFFVSARITSYSLVRVNRTWIAPNGLRHGECAWTAPTLLYPFRWPWDGTASSVPKYGEAGQRKAVLRGACAASGMASAKELDVREPSARISRRHVENDVSHARNSGADGKLWGVMGHQTKMGHRGEWLVIRAGEGEGWEKNEKRTRMTGEEGRVKRRM
jgi:hypothetical protein